ncbi:MAG TPA: CoA transferase, partial [Acetobacteraceae bacterium]|nr:CoA transferase [Acetobacteraceae bacterium]
MGSPDWGNDTRFLRKADRVANWDALHAFMSGWSVQHARQWIADAAQQAHVPSFPLREPDELFGSAQLRHRRFFRSVAIDGRALQVPGSPFGLSFAEVDAIPSVETGPMPLSGVRVLDFSWVIAGPTTTRYLAAMGAEVIKVEAPGRGDPGRASELHTVLGQAKRAIVLDLKRPDGVALARALAGKCDVLIENFATGVMDRLGLGADALRGANPNLVYVSASGLGRSGPESHAVAYGTLLQCYSGFAGLNRHPDRPPRVGFAWLDPMCGLMLAFAVAAALWRRQAGRVARIDFSMVEAMLWTMADPLLAAQRTGAPQAMGNASDCHAPHGAWRCADPDSWLALAVRGDAEWRALCALVPELRGMADLSLGQRRDAQQQIDAALAAWLAPQDATRMAEQLCSAGIPAAALADSAALVGSAHLRARGFWQVHAAGVLPGLPWTASFGRVNGPAPELGADTDAVLRDILQLSEPELAELRRGGTLG